MSTMQCVCGAEAEEGTEGWEWRRDGEYRHGMRYCPDCVEAERTAPVPCMWFALCENEATTTRRGPIGDGKFGEVPICGRCDAKIGALE